MYYHSITYFGVKFLADKTCSSAPMLVAGSSRKRAHYDDEKEDRTVVKHGRRPNYHADMIEMQEKQHSDMMTLGNRFVDVAERMLRQMEATPSNASRQGGSFP